MTKLSIFNDVIGPVMRGPSSSHTAGTYRIAKLACDLLGGAPPRLRCSFDPSGSYAPTYQALGVEAAFAAGCLDWAMTDPRYETATAALAESGVSLGFDVAPLASAEHPNAVRIRAQENGKLLHEIGAKSTGGGIVCIDRLDGFKLAVDGRSWSLILRLSSHALQRCREELCSLLDSELSWHSEVQGGEALLQGDLQQEVAPDTITQIAALQGVSEVRQLRPVLYTQPGPVCFRSAEEMCAAAGSRALPLGAFALRSEALLLGRSETAVLTEMRRRYRVMQQSVAEGLEDSHCHLAYSQPCAASILKACDDGKLPLGGAHTRAAARAMAAMHVSNSGGVVCAAPTGGSAGVLPAVLLSLEDECGIPEARILHSLFAAGAVGLIIAKRATFAAEVAGCQVEIGAAGAMAAAAVVDAMGGSPEQACHAAAVSLQNTMGSVCDPVGGGCEIPCHTRNAAAASSAFVCADLVIGGYNNPIPLDESVDASLAVGRMLPPELRCTARGGLAVTPSAQTLTKARVLPGSV